MPRIFLPVDRLASTGNHYAGSQAMTVARDWHCGRQMHQSGHPAENALGPMDQPNQLAKRGPASKIDATLQFRMEVPCSPDLNELNSTAKVIHHSLVALTRPPLDGHIMLPSRHHKPIRQSPASQRRQLSRRSPFRRGKVNIASKLSDAYFKS